ncbi:MAG: hypothetical protein P8N09_11215 [Planctomycetota bacterium]|jgi:hypothetical protein|nr:hypothetical protein [Planctomycetota bacterium]
MVFHINKLVMFLSMTLALAFTAIAQDPQSEPASEIAPPLSPGTVARVGDIPISEAEYFRYLGTVYAREPEGKIATTQELTERVLMAAAAATQVEVDESDVQDLAERLDARARTESGGSIGLVESLGAEESELRHSLGLLALQEKIIAVETGVSHPSDQQLRAWMENALSGFELQPAPLHDAVATRWHDGEITRIQLGRRLYALLTPEDRAGVLTELIGILLIRAATERAGLELTAEALAEEIARRDALVRNRDETSGISYADMVKQMQNLTVEELISTPSFGAQVRLRLLVEQRWDETRLRSYFEDERASFEQRFGPDITFEAAQSALWREVRQLSYRQLFSECRIVRSF